MDTIIQFLNSNLFGSISVFFTGGAVILVLKLQKRIEKTQASRIVLMDIRGVEKAVSNIRNIPISGAIPKICVLSQNSWKKFNHLFSGDLDSDEMDQLDAFFTSGELIEEVIRKLNNYLPLQIKQKAGHIQKALVELAKNDKRKDYLHKKYAFLKTVEAENYWFIPNESRENLSIFLQNIRFVSTTSAGQKLKKIANRKF